MSTAPVFNETRFRTAARDPAGLCGVERELLFRLAWRADAGRLSRRIPRELFRCSWAAEARIRGCLAESVRRARCAPFAARCLAKGAARCSARTAEPRGRQSLLAWPLHRACGRPRATSRARCCPRCRAKKILAVFASLETATRLLAGLGYLPARNRLRVAGRAATGRCSAR